MWEAIENIIYIIVLLRPFIGYIAGVHFDDSSPIQGREYQTGDSVTNYSGNLDSGISIDANFPIVIEWDFVYTRKAGQIQTIYSKANAGGNCELRVVDDSGNVAWQVGGDNASFVAAMASVQDGQHITMRVESDGGPGGRRLYIDNVLIATNSARNWTGLTCSIDRIGGGATAGEQLVNGALANLKITATGVLGGTGTLMYKLDKQTDPLLIVNSGDFGSTYNGTWVAANWVDVPLNSRNYQMQEGEGVTLFDSVHPTDPAYNATLTSDAGWTFIDSPTLP